MCVCEWVCRCGWMHVWVWVSVWGSELNELSMLPPPIGRQTCLIVPNCNHWFVIQNEKWIFTFPVSILSGVVWSTFSYLTQCSVFNYGWSPTQFIFIMHETDRYLKKYIFISLFIEELPFVFCIKLLTHFLNFLCGVISAQNTVIIINDLLVQ